LRNFNFLLGFWFVDMTDGIQYPSDPDYDENVEKRIEALRVTPTEAASEAEAALEAEEASSSGSDYSPSGSEESEEESFVEDLEDATVVTTDFEKWVFNVDTLNLVARMLESVILPKSLIRWRVISKTNYVENIQDKKTKSVGLSWRFITPSEVPLVKNPKINSLNDCFETLIENEGEKNVQVGIPETREAEHGSSGGKKKTRKKSKTYKGNR
jgi:hypothetical protein